MSLLCIANSDLTLEGQQSICEPEKFMRKASQMRARPPEELSHQHFSLSVLGSLVINQHYEGSHSESVPNELDVLAHAYHASTWEVEAGG